MIFRNRRVARAMACFLLLESISSLVLPSVSWAMMGPSQNEFTSYEAPGSTDMVNLSTGDFSFNVPVLDIPGPERSFSLPLNYKAGIQLEQEATWVGLGWSLNPGAIARSVNGYADDADHDTNVSTYTKQVERGWTGGVPGIIDLGWNSNTGHSGSVDLLGLAGYSWDKDGGNAEVMGLKMGDAGISIDPVKMVSAIITVASLGTTAGLSAAADIGIQAASSVAIGVGMGAFGVGRMGEVNGFMNQPTITTEHHWFYDNYWVHFDNNSTEFAYGSLHFDDMSKAVSSQMANYNAAEYSDIDPTKASNNWVASQRTPYERGPTINAPGANTPTFKAKPFKTIRVCNDDGNETYETAADISQEIRKTDASYYQASTRPISIAHDNFNVMGEGVSGSIRPYRLEVGSIAYPKMGRNECDKHFKYMVTPFLDDYKVGFRYENSISNGYDYHEYVPTSGSTHQPEGIDFSEGDKNSSQRGTLTIVDPRLVSDAGTRADRTGSARKGLLNISASSSTRRLVQGKHVEWYTNEEIKAMYVASVNGNGNGFLEFAQPTATTGSTASNNPFRQGLPSKGIGAFAVTAEDGTTYHYSLPVYNHKTYSKSIEQSYNTATHTDNSLTGSRGIATQKSDQETATSWLLTAITSSDYIDRNNSGTVDKDDWGGWVKFDYGKLTGQFKWRQPYVGGSYPDDIPVVNNVPNSDIIASWNFSSGYRDSYYLNSISTRTHTALFVKSIRQDGRGAFSRGLDNETLAQAVDRSLLKIDERAPSASLRLDEVILLDNATLEKLQTQNGIRTSSDTGPVIPSLTNDTGSNAATYLRPDPKLGGLSRWYYPVATTGPIPYTANATPDASYSPYDNMGNVLDKHDLDADARIRQFVDAHALKRVVFNYSYDLCRGTPNSFYPYESDLGNPRPYIEYGSNADSGGKLTLRSVSFFGPSVGQVPTKIIPDFVFQYGGDTYVSASNTGAYGRAYTNNPEYGQEKWDGFGMYNYDGKYSLKSHLVSYRADTDGAAWSLTKITNPLGGSTQINYERDEYSHVAEFGTARLSLTNTNSSAELEVSAVPDARNSGFAMPLLGDVLKAGDKIPLTGKAGFTPCTRRIVTASLPVSTDRIYDAEEGEIRSLRYDIANRKWLLTLVNAPVAQIPSPTQNVDCSNAGQGTGMRVETVVPNNIKGGDIRVSSIVTADENGTPYQVRYKYQKSGPDVCNSSGVLAKEPPFIGRFEHAHYSAFDFPATPVLYSEVTVLRGTFKNGNNDYDQREVYAFHTPHTSMVSQNAPAWHGTTNFYNPDNVTPTNKSYNNIEYFGNNAVVDVGKIGQPRWVRKYNRRGDEELNTTFDYTSTIPNPDNIAGQGQFTEGVMNNEMLDLYSYRINRSTKRYLPSVMYASQSTRNGVSIANTNSLFDFYTGQVLESRFVNSRGETYRTVNVPAYSKSPYVAMGAKGDDRTNHNMLSQMAASYVYRESGNTSQLLSAGIQTWKSAWDTYRDFIGSTYQNETATAIPVWRESASYAWQSSQLNPNGTYANFVNFAWTGTPNSHWVKTGETVRYDHYSHTLEARDINALPSAQKIGYNQTQVIAAATNTRYTELAYSGAEDLVTVSGSAHFGGEVIAGGVQDVTKAHTGLASLRLENGQQGFVYQATGGTELDLNKPYRLSVWVHANDAVAHAGRLYIAVNGTTVAQTSIAAAETKKAGSWYRLSLVATLPSSASGQLITFGCANTAATPVYFDDFRVCPVTASMSSRVYDTPTNRLTYSLDNENLYVRYEYDKAGKLKRVYKETLDRPNDATTAQKLVKEYEYNYARGTAPNWVTVSYQCETNPDGAINGYEIRSEMDVNPLSPTYNTTNTVKAVNGKASTCHVCNSDPNVLERFVAPTTGGGAGTCFVGQWIGSRQDARGCVGGHLNWWKTYQFGPTYTEDIPQTPIVCTPGSGGTPVIPSGPAQPRTSNTGK
ncbi:hypothetical protein ACFP2F_21710 [Hymenobacter artigasi]